MREERILFINNTDIRSLQKGLPMVLVFGTERLTLQYERTAAAERMARLKAERAKTNGKRELTPEGLEAVRRNAKRARAALAAKRREAAK